MTLTQETIRLVQHQELDLLESPQETLATADNLPQASRRAHYNIRMLELATLLLY